MSAAYARAPLSGAVPATPAPRDEDRWLGRAGVRRLPAAMVGLLMLSILLHGALVATALVADRVVTPPQLEETPVEIVTEEPKPAGPEKAGQGGTEHGKTEHDKTSEAAKKEDTPALKTAAAAEPAKPPDLKPALPPPPEPPPAEPPQKVAETPPPKPPKPVAAAPKPPTPAEDAAAKELEALQRQLADLKADLAKTAPPAEEPVPTMSQANPSLGVGPLPDSFQAVAMSTPTADGDEPVGYTAVVFSQLAKAKGIGSRMGQPGSAGVRFSIDESGKLIRVALVVSSGIKELDTEALAIVRRAAPFPAPPKGAQRDFSANVSFVAGSKT